MTNFPRLLYYLAKGMRRLYWDCAQLRIYQERKLRSVIKYAYNYVPFYHEKFKKANVRPEDIKSLDDLSKLPLIKKNEFKNILPRQRVSLEYNIERLKKIATSGSTGEPFTIYISSREDDWRKSIYMRANISCGQKPWDKWVVITAPHHFHDTTSIQRIFNLYAQTCISVFMPICDQVQAITNLKPDILDGYSGALFLIAKEFSRSGGVSFHSKIIFGSAELIDNAAQRFIEKVFCAPYLDQFGCAEIDRSSWQCPEKIGYHMDVDSVIMEFVDDDGYVVSTGERGEIVYTSLFNYAMPIIRYAIGDIGITSNDECPCGRKLPLMKIIEGRKDSFLVLPDGQFMSPRVFTNAINRFCDKIIRFQVVQKKINFFEIYIQLKEDIVEEVFENEFISYIRSALNFDDDIFLNVRFVDELSLVKSGKLSSVVSEIKVSPF